MVAVGTGMALKFAVTALAEDITTVQVPDVLVQAPDHPVNVEPAVMVAVRVTEVLWLYEYEQVAPQLIPAGLEVTVPEPVPVLVTVKVFGPGQLNCSLIKLL